MSGLAPRDDVSDSGDSANAAIAEVEAAIKANPELRGKTPPPQHGDQWEDYERVLTERPELAQPVAASNPATAFYYSKDMWECGHSSEPARTGIEREAVEGEKDGIDLATGHIHPAAILTNEIRGICPKCMEKWSGPSAGGVQDRGGSSRNPAGLPEYSQPPPQPPPPFSDFDDDFGEPGLNRDMGTLDVDEGPGKGKYPVGGQPAAPPDHPGDNYYGDDFSERSVSPPGPQRGPPGAPPPGPPPDWGPRHEGNDPPAMPPSPTFNPPPGEHGQPPAHGGGAQGGRQPLVADDFDDYDDDYDHGYDDDLFFHPPPGADPPQGHSGSHPPPGGGGDPPPY